MELEEPRLHPDFIQQPYSWIGEGGEHIVVGNPHIPVEGFRRITADITEGTAMVSKYSRLAFIACNGVGISPEQAHQTATSRAARVNKRHHMLQQIFGLSTVEQMSEGHTIHLEPEEVRYIWGNQTPPRKAGEFATVVTHQVRIAALEAEPTISHDFFSFDLPYAERHAPIVDRETYATVNQRWLARSDKGLLPTDTEIAQFMAVHHTSGVRRLLEAPVGSPLERAGRAFTWYGEQYSNYTGETLDLASRNNVAFREFGTYRLLDALFPTDIKLVRVASDIVSKAQDDVALTYRDRINLLNALGYIRTINFMSSFRYGSTINTFANKGIRQQTWDKVYDYLTHLPTKQMLHAPTALYVE